MLLSSLTEEALPHDCQEFFKFVLLLDSSVGAKARARARDGKWKSSQKVAAEKEEERCNERRMECAIRRLNGAPRNCRQLLTHLVLSMIDARRCLIAQLPVSAPLSAINQPSYSFAFTRLYKVQF